MHAVDGRSGLLESRVFDKSVALLVGEQVSQATLHAPASFIQIYLHVTTSPVKVEMEVLDLAVFAKFVLYGLLVGFLVDIRDGDDPALDGAHSCSFGVGAHLGLVSRGSRWRGARINFHFDVGHCV